MLLRRSLALEAVFLLLGPPISPRSAVLGVVVYARGAHLGAGAVSTGATVFDGDRLSTEAGGELLVRGEASVLELGEGSAVILRGTAIEAQSTAVNLAKGTVVFSAARAVALEIQADEAQIRPAAQTPTVGQVSVAGPKELRVYARRGPLEFSYRGEIQTIAEGQSYLVILDPPEDIPRNEPSAKKPRRRRRAFLLLAVAAAGASSIAVIYEMLESSDRP